MEARAQRLRVLPGRLAVCRLEPGAELPPWVGGADREVGLLSITRTAAETSIVCPQESVPAGVRCAAGWRALEVAGPLDFGEVGVLAALAGALAASGVSLFAVSTFDTDYLLVRAADLDRAVAALAGGGHEVAA